MRKLFLQDSINAMSLGGQTEELYSIQVGVRSKQ